SISFVRTLMGRPNQRLKLTTPFLRGIVCVCSNFAPQLRRAPLGKRPPPQRSELPTYIMFLRSLTLLSILLFAADASIKAQGRPTQALQSAFAALAHRDWPALAAVVHPTALESLRQESLGLMILVAEDRRVGKQGGGYNPREVVLADHLARVGSEHVPQFPGHPTIGQLASLPVPEFFVRWCDAVYHADSAADPVRDVVGFQRRIFGEVTEGDSLAHLLYRRESRHVEMGELFVDLPGQV